MFWNVCNVRNKFPLHGEMLKTITLVCALNFFTLFKIAASPSNNVFLNLYNFVSGYVGPHKPCLKVEFVVSCVNVS